MYYKNWFFATLKCNLGSWSNSKVKCNCRKAIIMQHKK